MKKEQLKQALQEAYGIIDQMHVKGADNIYALSNVLGRIQFVFEGIDKLEENITIDNTKEATK